jgi:hypothetical protein
MSLLITDRTGGTHGLPTEWLGKRVVGWMSDEANGSPWWLCALTREGKFHYASHDGVNAPGEDYISYARRVCRHLNRECHNGGAWLVGWFDNGMRFYLLWKDPDGDIQIPIECDLCWETIREWALEDWAEQAAQALSAWESFHQNMNYRPGQCVKLAQGERLQ